MVWDYVLVSNSEGTCSLTGIEPASRISIDDVDIAYYQLLLRNSPRTHCDR